MLCAVGGQAGEKNSGAFLKFSKTITFHRKEYPHKTKDICLVVHFSLETTKKTNVKNFCLSIKIFFWLRANA